ncbi:RDD family protein [Ideonella sp. DXS29W]|uniref:RDD family protein n=1 Tax=Ideonella lacteola TaxID=2984193 RepID=A0ABU9BQK9_9BURK
MPDPRLSRSPLDTLRRVETPEGVALALRPAGAVARGIAFLIDFLIRLLLIGTLGAVLSTVKGIGDAFWLIGFFVLEWFYPVLFELSPAGATPGKMAVGLRVVMDDGLPVTASASMLRNLLRAADFLPMAYGAGLLSMLCRRDFKRLGDLAASTLVVYDQRHHRPSPWPDAPVCAPAAGRALSFDQQRALMHLASRVARLTPQRADELAALAEPLLQPGTLGPDQPLPESAALRMVGVARWLRGDQSAALSGAAAPQPEPPHTEAEGAR